MEGGVRVKIKPRQIYDSVADTPTSQVRVRRVFVLMADRRTNLVGRKSNLRVVGCRRRYNVYYCTYVQFFTQRWTQLRQAKANGRGHTARSLIPEDEFIL
jgi:hypothetical protein